MLLRRTPQPAVLPPLLCSSCPSFIIVVFWLFLIRPQQKRAKEHQKMVEGLNKGDEVMTAGGIMGKVADLDEQNVKIQISTVEGTPVTIVMARQTIANVLPKGTVKF